MPYRSTQALPDRVRHVLPAHAQEIYNEAFNSAWEQYKHQADRRDDARREETARNVGWCGGQE
jgi:Putative cation transport regulator